MERLYSIEDASNMLGVSESYLYKQVASKNIWHRRIGTRIKFTNDDLEEFANREIHPACVEAAEKYGN